jgi:hypothetical protein
MSGFQPSNDYMIDNTIYQIFTEDSQTKKQYLLEQLNYYNQCKYYTDKCTYCISNNLPLPIAPIPPTPPN